VLPGRIPSLIPAKLRLILELANNPERLSTIKDTLSTNRQTEPLFDTQRYVRNFEAGLSEAYRRYLYNCEAEDIWMNF
jgi:protein O-GlcNAc transferase